MSYQHRYKHTSTLHIVILKYINNHVKRINFKNRCPPTRRHPIPPLQGLRRKEGRMRSQMDAILIKVLTINQMKPCNLVIRIRDTRKLNPQTQKVKNAASYPWWGGVHARERKHLRATFISILLSPMLNAKICCIDEMQHNKKQKVQYQVYNYMQINDCN